MEIVDLETDVSSCPSPSSYPRALYGPMGIYGFQDKPIVCGGFDYVTIYGDCFVLENGAWKNSYSMIYPRFSAALTLSPFSNSSQILFMTGGYTNGYVRTNLNEVLTSSGWEIFSPPLPMTFVYHCMVLWNSSTVLVIGGLQDGTPGFKTYFIQDKNRVWVEGPSINFQRYAHGCARINQDNRSQKLSIIIAGGYATGGLTSVEVLDEGATSWRIGTSLPIKTWSVNLVEDPRGGVIMVGGYTGVGPTIALYRLKHAGNNVNWEQMPQKLKIGNNMLLSIIIPDMFFPNCTIT